MSDAAIKVQGLAKLYQLGAATHYKTLRESLMGALRAPARVFRRPRPNANANGNGNGNGNAADSRPDKAASTALWALNDVSFDVQKGEVVGIIGRNGAGKSTLLKILSRITEPTRGRVEMRGRVGTLLEVGTGFHPELTGRENIYLNGAILGMSQGDIRRKFDEMVAFSEVEKFLDTPVKRYSSGMYMRLAFAVAAHLEPEIMVVDEVLAVGDVEFQKKCLGKMKDVGQQGRTVLFVSHNLSYVSKLCTRGVLLEAGRVRRDGPVNDVINEYLAKSAADPAVVDLQGFRSSHGHGAVSVANVELVNAVGGSFAACWDEPLRLRVRLRAHQPVDNLSFGIGCQTADSVPLFTVRTADADGFALRLAAGEERAVCVSIDHNLRAGFYLLALGVAAGNYAHYYHPTAVQLQILDVGRKVYLDKNTGLINCGASWSLE